MATPKPRSAARKSAKISGCLWGIISSVSPVPVYPGQTGDYINTITSDVNNYEKILTHKIGDLAKNFALSIMLIVFVMTIYVPAG